MKKIFAISVLSIMTVLSSNAWAGDISLKEAYGLGSAADYNIATVQFVEERANNLYEAIGERVSKYNRDQRQKVVTTDANGYVQFSDAIDQDQVSGLTDALAGKVDDTQIANADADVADGDMDTMVPTVQRMANAIADAVSTGVGAVDLSSRVAVNQGTEKANQVLVTDADGKVTTASTITQAQVENLGTDLAAKFNAAQVVTSEWVDMNGNELSDDLTADQIVPTVANVEANFIPNVSNSYVVSTDSQYWGEETQGKAPAGSYIITVDVDQNGNATYHWVQYYGSDPV